MNNSSPELPSNHPEALFTSAPTWSHTHPEPSISVVTPSFNQAAFLADTIQSVISPQYPFLEYVVIDGGSQDGSVEILRHFGPQITEWISEPDRGQYDAINKGFARTTGEIMAWLNSDDQYLPWTLRVVSQIFAAFPEVQWLTSVCPLHLSAEGLVIAGGEVEGFSRLGFFRGENLPVGDWHATSWIQQESTFWRRCLWEKVGGRLDADLKMAADFDLWARFFRETELYGVRTPLAAFRLQPRQKTEQQMEAYQAEAWSLFLKHGGKLPGAWESFYHHKLARCIRWLERKYRQRLAPFGVHKVITHRGREGGWRIKTY